MSGADRRAEEQGYYQADAAPARTKPAAALEVPLSEVCAGKGHKPSATEGMKTCACGERTYEPDPPTGLF